MATTRADVLDMLRELVELTTLDEADVQAFRVRGYESALRGVEAHPGDPTAMSAAELQKLDGVGKSTASKIRELVDTGRVSKLEALRAKYPPGVVALTRVPGVGPKATRRLVAELGVNSVDDLRRAVAEHRLRDLRGFGEKSEEKLAKVLERLAHDGADKRTPIAAAMPVARRLVAEIAALPGVVHAEYCGSLRRFSETIGDLDVVVAATNGAPVVEAVVQMPFVVDVIARGDTKASVRTRRGLQIDVRVVAPEQIGAALMYFTGSKAHNVALRQRALDRGMTLNEYALAELDGGRIVARETEEAIYAALGLPWIDPVLREDVGELALAERRALPERITRINADLHVHTSLSGDGRSSLEEMVASARARGLSVLAITEHAEGLPMNGVGREALLDQRERIAALQRETGDALTILHGIELNIGPDGELDYDLEFRKGFDWCLASIHDHFDLDRARQTKRVVAAMNDPTVDMIGHLSARTIGGRPPVDLDLDSVFTAAERTGTALEINGGLPRLDVSVDVMRQARGRDVTFVLSSDAHQHDELERLHWAANNALRAWVPPERIANSWPRERFLAWVGRRRGARA